MRKVLVLAAALTLCSVPAAAQQQSLQPAPAAAPAAQSAPAEHVPTPSLYVSREQIDARLRQVEAAKNGESEQIGSQSWWYLVLAIAVGVLIAVIIAD
jgi:curli biogenesis system outer membrane secretion channel CsgG